MSSFSHSVGFHLVVKELTLLSKEKLAMLLF